VCDTQARRSTVRISGVASNGASLLGGKVVAENAGRSARRGRSFLGHGKSANEKGEEDSGVLHGVCLVRVIAMCDVVLDRRDAIMQYKLVVENSRN
jgi:hypothetical protein